jgi:diadenosine tetraphosphatase ApaH/serine/threonine PP2A family protein phosphatase
LVRGSEPRRGSTEESLLWSDPDERVVALTRSPRGAGFLFSKIETVEFLKSNNLQTLIRSHQVVNEGCESFHGGSGKSELHFWAFYFVLKTVL